jgi:hypothetical protein
MTIVLFIMVIVLPHGQRDFKVFTTQEACYAKLSDVITEEITAYCVPTKIEAEPQL